MIVDPLFYAAAIPAVILMGLSKGGFSGLGLLSLPLMALVVSPVQSAAIMLPILIVQDVVTVWAYRHAWDRRNVAILVPSATLGILAGYLLAALCLRRRRHPRGRHRSRSPFRCAGW